MKRIIFVIVLLATVVKGYGQCANPVFNGALWGDYIEGYQVYYTSGGVDRDYEVKSGYSSCWTAPTLDGGSCWVEVSDPCAAAGTAPTVTTTTESSVLEETFSSGGNISAEGSSPVIARGVCWSTGTTPTISDFTTTDGTGTGTFT